MPHYNERTATIHRKIISKNVPTRDWFIIQLSEKGDAYVTIGTVRFPKKYIGKRVRMRAEFLDYTPRKRRSQDAKIEETNTPTV